MNHATTINPFYAARQYRPASEPPAEQYKPIFVRLPRIPVNASPVPTLTSLYHNHRAGEYGDRGYPGNCGGNLIKDLLLYFKPRTRLRPHDRQRHMPRRMPGTRHPMRVVRHPSGHGRLRPRPFSASPAIRARSISFGLIRPTGGRSSMPTIRATCPAPRRWSVSAALRPVHPQLRRCV